MTVHGGKRTGAGRRPVDKTALEEKLLETLIIPAFHACELGNVALPMGIDDLKYAHGIRAIVLFKQWFQIVRPSSHIAVGQGSSQTMWNLKLSMTIAAKMLLATRTGPFLFPTQALQEHQHRKQYNKFWKEHAVHCAEFGIVSKPEPYKPLVFDAEQPTSLQVKQQFDGWLELINKTQYRVLLNSQYTGFIPDEQDVPY